MVERRVGVSIRGGSGRKLTIAALALVLLWLAGTLALVTDLGVLRAGILVAVHVGAIALVVLALRFQDAQSHERLLRAQREIVDQVGGSDVEGRIRAHLDRAIAAHREDVEALLGEVEDRLKGELERQDERAVRYLDAARVRIERRIDHLKAAAGEEELLAQGPRPPSRPPSEWGGGYPGDDP